VEGVLTIPQERCAQAADLAQQELSANTSGRQDRISFSQR